MLKAKPMTLLQIENVLLVINMSQKLGSARVHLTSMLKLMKDSANLSDRQCDVTFICKRDGRTIHAHSVVMKNISLLVENHLSKSAENTTENIPNS